MKLLHALVFCGVILVGAEQLIGPRGRDGVLPGSGGKIAAGLASNAAEGGPPGAAAAPASASTAIDPPITDAANGDLAAAGTQAGSLPVSHAGPVGGGQASGPALGVAGMPVAAPRAELVESPGRV